MILEREKMIDIKKLTKKGKKRKLTWDFGMTAVLILFLFRIPISNILGSEGNGYLAIAWEIYTVFGLFFGWHLGKSITLMVKKRVSKHQYHNGTKVLTTALAFCGLLAGLGAVILYFVAGFITDNLLDVKLSRLGVQLSAILLLVSVLANVFRGYFEGIGTKIPTYFSRILEVLTAGTVSCIVALSLGNYGKKVGALLFNEQYKASFGASGVMVGGIAGILIALLFLLIVNFIYQIPLKDLYKKDETKVLEPVGTIITELLKTSLVMVSPLVFICGYRLLNMVLYIQNNMVEGEGTVIRTIQQIGSYHGKILVLVGIVCASLLGLGSGNLKKIQHFYSKNNYAVCKKCIIDDLKRFAALSILMAGVFIIGGEKILQFIFKKTSPTEVGMLKVGGIGIVFVVVAIYFYRIFSLIKKETILIIISVVAFILQTLFMSVQAKNPDVGVLSIISSELLFWSVFVILEGIFLMSIFNGKKIFFEKKF